MEESLYIVKDAPGKGRGMFATRDIKRGTCIISESPLVYFYNTGPADTIQAVNDMSKKNKKYFLALRNSHPELPQDIGIIKTNALPLGCESLDCAVFRVISRINHSCALNVKHSWNAKLKKETIFATEDIPAGSEIVTDYLSLLMTREERLKRLAASFGFTCQCKYCASESSEEYDAAVNRIKECSDLIASSCAASNPRRSIGYVREVLGLIDKIDGWGKSTFYHDGFQISAMYSNYTLAKEWADLLLESYRIEEGEVGEKYERYLMYSQNPRSHERAGWGGYIDLTGA
ncbi:hypothetical protein BGZ65_008152 [Modicella reniformis]|uniref:SET domain-containing protein n=1 Tax=Modicella reniformis TaxID=1440133 RepID=A0A9P6JH48_9FUNG|nr:hypothetical protein BGZ65_008152 [Modicella reniformis]